MNFLKLIGLIVINKTLETAQDVQDSVTHTVRVLYLAILSCLVFLLAGITVAAFGAVTFGKGLILTGGLISTVLFVLFSTRALLLGELIVLASQLGHDAVAAVPAINREKADALLKWLRGITIWVMIVSFYAMIFPVWENVGNFVIAVVCGVILATMASAWGEGVPSFRKLAVWSVLAVFLGITFQFFAPETTAKVKGSVSYWLSRATELGNRKEALGTVEHQAKLVGDNQDAAVLTKIRQEQADIRTRAIQDKKCLGVICNKADQERYELLEAAAQQVLAKQNGTEPEKEEAAPSNGSASKLPPPPVAPIAKPENKTPVLEPAKAERPAAPPSDKEVDKTFEELKKYGL